MTKIIELLNQALTWIFDILLLPLNPLSPLWGLTFVSLVSGILLIYLYGLVSNQTAIKKIKRNIHANMLEAVIFRHDLGVSLGAQGRMLSNAFKYLLNAVPAIIVLSVPCILILAQLNLRYAFRPLNPGEESLVKINLKESDLLYKVSLATPETVSTTPPLRMEDQSEIVWRIKTSEASTAPAKLDISGLPQMLSDKLEINQSALKLPAESYASGWMQLLYPGGTKLPEGVYSFSVKYPERDYTVLGLHIHWLILFFILSMISGLVAGKIFKIEI